MSINKPYHRNYRKMKEGEQFQYSDGAYIVDREYAQNPEHYTRAFSIIQADLLKLFEYIEPSDINEITYSFRIHELFMRTSIEVEANFKAILRENIFSPTYKNGNNKGEIRPENEWNINDFKLINKTHHLDEYSIELPFWQGNNKIRIPFLDWKTSKSLKWYQSYNKSKHERFVNFKEASFGNLIEAYSGLFVLLSSQFKTESFLPGNETYTLFGNRYFNGSFGIGDFLMVRFPDNWKDDEMYCFNWMELKNEKERFLKIDYNKI